MTRFEGIILYRVTGVGETVFIAVKDGQTSAMWETRRPVPAGKVIVVQTDQHRVDTVQR